MTQKEKPTAKQDFVSFLNSVRNAHADRVNPAFKSRYSSLSEVLDTVKDAAAPFNLALHQRLSSNETEVRVSTIILHADGTEFDCGSLAAKSGTMNPQQLGSAITYLRRQSIQTACGISVDLDDDANKASNTKPKTPGVWFTFIPLDLRPKAIDYLRSKCWIPEGGLLDDLPDDKQELISAQQNAFLKAIQK